MLTLVASVTRRRRSRSLAPFGASAQRLVRPVRLAALGILILPALLHAQRLFGAGEDASVLKPREWRWSFGARWTSWDEALDGAGQRSAINGRFTNPDAGPAFFGGLLPTQGFLRSAMGDSTIRVSMGAARLRSELHQDRIPIALEVGVSKRLTVGLYLPLVNTYAGAAFDLNRLDPSSANVGLNPGFQNNTFASAAGTVQAEASAAVAASGPFFARSGHGGTRDAIATKALPFDLTRVRLGGGPFRDATENNRRYMQSLDSDSLLHIFRITAGFPSSAHPSVLPCR